MRLYSFEAWIPVLALGIAAGCSSSREVVGQASAPDDRTIIQETSAQTPREDPRERRVLIDEITKWIGTPYVFGGTTRSGIDCSAFVRNVYSAAYGLELPRTTDQQVHAGFEITPADLRMGDLVFFRPSGKSRHVGIYLDGGEFAHASTNQGVTISRLDEAYWTENWWTARRVLELGAQASNPPIQPTSRPVAAQVTPPASKKEPEKVRQRTESRSGRVGW